MFPIAGQTAGPNGLKCLWTLMGGRGCYRLKKIRNFVFEIFFFQNFFLHGQRWTLQLVTNILVQCTMYINKNLIAAKTRFFLKTYYSVFYRFRTF